MEEKKSHPEADQQLETKSMTARAAKELVNQITNEVASDDDARSEWIDRQETYYERRYARLSRNVQQPWPNASDIVIPTTDMTIDRLKASLSRVIFTRPMVSMKARNPRSIKRVMNSRRFMEWLLTEGIDDFQKQIILGLDQMLQTGITIFKVFWDARTIKRTKVFRKRDFLREAETIITELDNLAGGEFQSKAEEEARKLAAIQELAQRREPEVRERIAGKYNLRENVKEDKKALDQIVSFFKSPRKEVKVKLREYVSNCPRVAPIDNEHIVVPPTTHDIQTASRITHKLFFTEPDFKARAFDRKWKTHAVQKALRSERQGGSDTHGSPIGSSIQHSRAEREGLSSFSDDGLIEVWEHYRWMDIHNDGRAVRVKMTIHRKTKALLKDVEELPFDHGQWPFVSMQYELNDPRIYSSRGVPEKIDDLDKEITLRHRNKLNNMDLMVPMFTYRLGSRISPGSFSFKPGAMIPVSQPGDIAPLQVPDRTVTDRVEENDLFTLIQRYIGEADSGLVNVDNLSEARTATEINAIQQTSTQRLSFQAKVAQIPMKRIYGMIWDLWQQYGPDDVYIRVTGEKLQRLSRYEIQGDFDINPIGTVETSDPQLEAQKALLRLNVIMDMISKVGPDFLGDAHELSLGTAFLNWLQRDSLIDSDMIVRERTPEEIQQIRQAREQAAQAQEAERQRLANEGLTPGEARAAVSELKKAQPNVDFKVKAAI